jgi:hypothetical protein
MTGALAFAPGGYRYMPGVFQYSGGVAAAPGFRLERVRFTRPVPLAEGFARAEAIMAASGRPTTAFAACELHSPAPFTEAGFTAFNQLYCGTLARWGIYRDGINPVARSNTCPEIGAPAEPGFHAFCFTRPAEAGDGPSFVVAGSGEAPEGKGNYRDHIVARGDVSPDGLRRKALFVLGEMERRLAALGAAWDVVGATQVYTVHDLHPFLADELARRGAIRNGLTWQFNRPPVVELDFEMDCRRVPVERLVEA